MALVETITAAVLGGGFALFGGWLTNRNNKQNSDAQRQHEKWKSNRDLYIKKGEELHQLFNQWHNNVVSTQTYHIMYIVGQMDALKTNEEYKAVSNKDVSFKLDSIVDIYYEELRCELNQLKDIEGKMNLQYGGFLTNNIEKNSAAIKITELTEKLRIASLSFRDNIRKETRKHL
ncbi:hypothetical protein M8S83_16425 [Enterobacter asburiae]|uniref:hypothetical protein n=1 Tax=Enterobacter asburiae TaxID=61645 RepID=UPI0020756BC0|nr:hypothetical protein [Enterobacter asburiae]MCM7773689.1 hypothetical protein [Enterobacter asburiae]